MRILLRCGLLAVLVMSATPAFADDARDVAARLSVGDSRADALAKIGKDPSYTESQMVLGVEKESLSFKVGLTSVVVVDLVLGRVVAVQTKSVMPWDSH